jgi:hypothetical protein
MFTFEFSWEINPAKTGPECRCNEAYKLRDSKKFAGPVSFSKEVEVYYESRKRELKRRLINEGRCDERLNAKVEESTCLTYTGLNDKTN